MPEWTNEQKQVFDSRDRDLLVSAAAGSGKTAVLVERIIRLVTDPEHPVDIDRLCVVTFTRAAAAEMKDRIGKALEERLGASPENAHLQRQGVLLHHAQITTIDSFCSFVIQNYFHRIGLDPDFRIAEEGELRLLKAAVMEDLLEEEYAEASPAFLAFIEAYADGKDDKKAEDLILRLYDFVTSLPDPEDWLKAASACPEAAGELPEGAVPDSLLPAWAGMMKEEARLLAKDAARTAEFLYQRAACPDAPGGAAEILKDDREKALAVSRCESYAALYETVKNLPSFRTWRLKKAAPDETPGLREHLKARRDLLKEMVKRIGTDYVVFSPEEILEQQKRQSGPVSELVRLTLRFMERFSAEKRRKNLADFADLEHFALQILREKGPGGEVHQSAAARELASRFDEVMIDEYQDSNYIQEAILSLVSGKDCGAHNRFMVGDSKQSIYAFRKAEPALFMEKFDTYGKDGGESRRIDLSRNFRSRPEVLDAVNAFFRRLMQKEIGGISYDDAAALHAGAPYPAVPESPQGAADSPEEGRPPEAFFGPEDCRTELLLLDAEDEELGSDRGSAAMLEKEALLTAMRIRALKKGGRVWDRDRNAYRPVRYGDIVILLRSPGNSAETFTEVLTQEGIPSYALAQSGYFAAPEIRTVLDYLRMLDNPLQDIPCAAVLRSAIGGLTDSELARVRLSRKDGSLYEAAAAYAYGEDAPEGGAGEEAGPAAEDELAVKLRRFLDTLQTLRESVPVLGIHELIEEVLDRTCFAICAAAMPAGAQRSANLRMLAEKAVTYEASSSHGLFSFIRYIEKLDRYEVDYGEVPLAGEGEDTVRIMSIHKSKGLEFPIVFVSGLGRHFNTGDRRSAMLTDAEFGIGLDLIDPAVRSRTASMRKQAIGHKKKKESFGEELRVLYVAMTRAKEKLILTGVVKNQEKLQETLANDALGVCPPVPHTEVLGASSFMDWIVRSVPGPELCRTRVVPPYVLADAGLSAGRKTADHLEELKKRLSSGRPVHPETDRKLTELETSVYPFGDAEVLPAKMTVTEIKKASIEAQAEEKGEPLYEEAPVIPYVPEFLRSEESLGLSGAARGTILHRLLEVFDYGCVTGYSDEELEKAAEGQFAEVLSRGILSAEELQAVSRPSLLSFLRSPVGRRMKKAHDAGTLRREQPFVIDVPASQIRPEWPETEEILVQGTIDAYFEEDGGYVIVDYKTDRVFTSDGSDLVRKYRKQLEFYALALERITGKPVREAFLYSLTLDGALPCRLS